MNYCQDGLQVYSLEYTFHSIYGNYDLQPNNVNGRPYFKMGSYGLWWDGIDSWWIGHHTDKGQSFGIAYYNKDIFCPHHLSEWDWYISFAADWFTVGKNLGIICKYIVIQKDTKSEIHTRKINLLSNFRQIWRLY